MKLEDVIRSGRPMRRKEWNESRALDGIWLIERDGSLMELAEGDIRLKYSIDVSDVLADDWEVKPEEPEYHVLSGIVGKENVRMLRSYHGKDTIDYMGQLKYSNNEPIVRFIDERLVEDTLIHTLEWILADLLPGKYLPGRAKIEKALAEYSKHTSGKK